MSGMPKADPVPMLASAGRQRGSEIVIDAGDGRNAAPGEAGEVLIRAQQMMAGFLRPSGYEKLDPGAFHESGDLGYLDARGRLHLVGRAADVIN